MISAQKSLLEFVDEFAPQLPIHRRIKVYRGMADFIHSAAERASYQERAMILEKAESRCQHLKLKFDDERVDKNSGGSR